MAFILLFLTNRLFLPSVSLLLSPAAFSSPSFYFHFDVWMYSIVNRAFHVSPRLTFIILLVMILLLLLLLRERERKRRWCTHTNGSEGSAGNGGVVVATTELEWTSAPSEDALTVKTRHDCYCSTNTVLISLHYIQCFCFYYCSNTNNRTDTITTTTTNSASIMVCTTTRYCNNNYNFYSANTAAATTGNIIVLLLMLVI